jgi:hypothetical protein
MRTLDQWELLARATIRNITVENAKAVALLCWEAEQNGGKASTWHMSSIVHANGTCACADCRGGATL